jgi:hypothetical protein
MAKMRDAAPKNRKTRDAGKKIQGDEDGNKILCGNGDGQEYEEEFRIWEQDTESNEHTIYSA